MNCPNEHGEMNLGRKLETITFRGKEFQVEMEHYVCDACGVTVDDLTLAARNQKALSEAYRKAAGLLTGEEIVEGRSRNGWTQDDLARKINVGIASVKRWEGGQIQTKAMDDALQRAFRGEVEQCNPYIGNRSLSLERIKLVLESFGEALRRPLIKDTNSKGDKLLYEAKYLFYSDMVAYRELGQSMTGATYARLPLGPQLNNYKDLLPLIKSADATQAEPLTEHELCIIRRIAMTFPTNSSVINASHREPIWKDRKDGDLIPYTDAEKITVV